MTTQELNKFTERLTQYTEELKNIDYMINKGIISYLEYKTLVVDAYNDFNSNSLIFTEG